MPCRCQRQEEEPRLGDGEVGDETADGRGPQRQHPACEHRGGREHVDQERPPRAGRPEALDGEPGQHRCPGDNPERRGEPGDRAGGRLLHVPHPRLQRRCARHHQETDDHEPHAHHHERGIDGTAVRAHACAQLG